MLELGLCCIPSCAVIAVISAIAHDSWIFMQLANLRHEKFAQGLASGETQLQSYRDAGFSDPTRTGNPAKLAKDERVAARVAELRAQAAKVEEKAVEDAAKKLSLTKEKILAELMRIGFSDIGDAAEWTDSAVLIKDSARLSKDVRAAIREVSIVGNKVRLKMHSKIDALVRLGEHLGLFKQHVAMSGNVEVEVTEVASARAMFLDKLASIAVRLPAPPAQNDDPNRSISPLPSVRDERPIQDRGARASE